MPTIQQRVEVAAPVGRCFDLARSIEFHAWSMRHTGETAVAGVTAGLIGAGGTVTWRARHLGVWQSLTSRIVEFDRPTLFVDEMVRGAFKRFRHEHRFRAMGPDRTEMADAFAFESPLGPIGALADRVFLAGYMRRLLQGHAARLKAALEGAQWREFLAD